MSDDLPPLPPELQEKLDEVEKTADRAEAENSRFDGAKARLVGILCFGLALTLGIALRQGLLKSLMFGAFMALVGFVTAGFQRPKRK